MHNNLLTNNIYYHLILPKYNYKGELRSIGCYERFKNIKWSNFKNNIKKCFESKTEDEWKIILKKFKFIGVIVPNSYHLTLKNKFTDGTFTLYY